MSYLFVNRIAKEINDRGEYFPILGICLGFELMTYVAANGVEHRTDCSSFNQPLALEFKPSKFFSFKKHIIFQKEISLFTSFMISS